jgi:hypothetical protein
VLCNGCLGGVRSIGIVFFIRDNFVRLFCAGHSRPEG